MDRPPGTASTWTCPGCRRLVPARFDACRCGMARGAAPLAGETSENGPRRGLSLGEGAALIVMVVAAVVGYRGLRGGSGPGARSAPSPALQAEAVPPAPSSARPEMAAAPAGAASPLPSATTLRSGAAWSFEIPSPAARPTSGSTAPAFPASDVDVAREQGRQRLEAAIQRVASLGQQLVRMWQYYDGYCANNPAANPSTCEQLVDRIGRLAIAVGAGLDDAEDAARTSWLPPGEVRDLRKRYGLDAAGWDEIVRVTRQFRR
jgi:hypothetical protein